MQELETVTENTFARLPAKPGFDEADEPAGGPQASIFDLLNAVNQILKRFNEKEDLRDIFEDRWTVSEKIETILDRIHSAPRLRFSELFSDATSRTEVVVTFLAILELMRLKQIETVQAESFGEIEITRGQAPILQSAVELAENPPISH